MTTRPRTLIERFGFSDPDRHSPVHDEIQLWAYRNFVSIVRAALPAVDIDQSLPPDIKLEYPIMDRNQVIGFVDLYCPGMGVAIEVKTEIKSIGELIRQIQFYRQYLSGPRWIVIAPSFSDPQMLRQQGVVFVEYTAKNG